MLRGHNLPYIVYVCPATATCVCVFVCMCVIEHINLSIHLLIVVPLQGCWGFGGGAYSSCLWA